MLYYIVCLIYFYTKRHYAEWRPDKRRGVTAVGVIRRFFAIVATLTFRCSCVRIAIISKSVQKSGYIFEDPFTRTVALPIFVTSDQFCQAVCPILPGSLSNFEIGIFLSFRLILCNVMNIGVGCLQKLEGRPGKISRAEKIRLILAVSCKRPLTSALDIVTLVEEWLLLWHSA